MAQRQCATIRQGPQFFGELPKNRRHGANRWDRRVGDRQGDEPRAAGFGEAGRVGETELGAFDLGEGQTRMSVPAARRVVGSAAGCPWPRDRAMVLGRPDRPGRPAMGNRSGPGGSIIGWRSPAGASRIGHRTRR
jgi:hypothetical protein